MDKFKYIKLENPDGSYTDNIPLAVDAINVSVNDNDLPTVLAEKASISFVNEVADDLEEEIQSIASGSPAGVYETYAALEEADPDHSKIYVVAENGHWYYYNEGWQDGGIYQAEVLDDEYQRRVDLLESNYEINTPAPSDNLTIEDARNEMVKDYTPIGKTSQKSYTQVEYLQSTGTQYIDTGIIPTRNCKIQASVMYSSTSQQVYAALLGTQNTEQGQPGFTIFSNSGLNARTGTGTTIINNAITIETNKRYEIELEFNKLTINNEVYTGDMSWNTDLLYSLYLFARNYNQELALPNSYIAVKLEWLKIYESDELVRDFVPVINSKNESGLYDLANNMFYKNKGTGSFGYGNSVEIIPVSPEHPQPIENVWGDVITETSNKNIFDEKLFKTDMSNLYQETITFENEECICLGRQGSTITSFTYNLACKQNTQYTFSAKYTMSNCTVYFIYSDGTHSTNLLSTTNTLTQLTATSAQNKTLIGIEVSCYGWYSTGSKIQIAKPQLEENPTATSYTPHQEQSITFPLAEGQKLMQGDYLAEDGIHHVRGQEVLDGTEIWNKDASKTPNDYYYISRGVMDLSKINDFKCSHFIKGARNTVGFWATSVLGITIPNTIIGVEANDDKDTRLTKWKNWLAEQYANGTPVIVEYELAQEQIIPYTQEQQTAWNNLQKLETYKGQTHIYTSSDGLAPDSKVTYRIDEQIQVDNLQLDINELKPTSINHENRIAELEQSNIRLRSNFDRNTPTPSDNLTIEDAINDVVDLYSPIGKTSQISYSGKNKMPFTNQDFTLNSVRYYVQDGELYLNGTSTGETSSVNTLFKQNFNLTLPAGEYTITHKIGVIGIYLYKYDDDSSIITIGQNTTTENFTLENDTQIYLGFYVYQNTFSNINTEIMIRPSSITDATYEPYVGGTVSPNPDYPQPIENVSGDVKTETSNKNLAYDGWAEDFVARVNDASKAQIMIKDGRRCLYYQASVGGMDVEKYYLFKTNWKANTRYTISFDEYSTAVDANFQINYTNNTYAVHNTSTKNEWTKYQITSALDRQIDCFKVEYYGGYTYIDLDTFVVQESTYIDIPLKGKIVTFPLAENQKLMQGDYLAEDGIHHVRGQYVYTGQEQLNKSGYTSSESLVCFKSIDNLKSGGSAGKCNIGIVGGINRINSSLNGFFYNTSGSSAFLKIQNSSIPGWDDSLSDSEKVNLFKAYLAEQYANGTPVTVEYELENEVVEPYTQEQQTAWNELQKLETYKGQTYIYTSSDGLAPDSKVTYLVNPLSSIEARLDLLEN